MSNVFTISEIECPNLSNIQTDTLCHFETFGDGDGSDQSLEMHLSSDLAFIVQWKRN